MQSKNGLNFILQSKVVRSDKFARDYKMNKYYKSEARERWSETAAYREHEKKTKNYTKEKWSEANDGLMAIFAEFAACKDSGASSDSAEAQALVAKLQAHITDNYYTCTDEILAGLGKMYVADERFKKNIDKYTENSATAINAVCRAQRNRFICCVVRDQALVAQLFDICVTVNNKDADITFFKRIVFHYKDAITAVECRFHTVTGDWDHKVSLLRLGRFINPNLFGQFGFEKVTGTG